MYYIKGEGKGEKWTSFSVSLVVKLEHDFDHLHGKGRAGRVVRVCVV